MLQRKWGQLVSLVVFAAVLLAGLLAYSYPPAMLRRVHPSIEWPLGDDLKVGHLGDRTSPQS